MTEPQRDQLRLVVNKRDNVPYDVYVGRPSIWGNPFFIGRDGTRDEVIAKYREHIGPVLAVKAKAELRGKVLACWCAPLPCHADVLVEIANG